MMNEGQREQFETLEQLREKALSRVARMSSVAINRTPAAGGWSAGQVLFHVIEAERLSLAYLNKRTKEPESIPPSGMVAAVKSRALGLFLKLPVKVAAPARTADVPASIELEELEKIWTEVRSGWQSFLREFPPELAGKAVYRHPVAGRLNLEQTLRFLIDHLGRHMGQIERALSESETA